MRINDPAIIAELTECHEIYERALIDNDADVLDALFWDSPHAIRYGVTENLHGAEEIRAFRRGRPKLNLDREIRRLDITALVIPRESSISSSCGSWNGIERYGRQTQFWFRFRGGLEDRLGSRVAAAAGRHISQSGLVRDWPQHRRRVSGRCKRRLDPHGEHCRVPDAVSPQSERRSSSGVSAMNNNSGDGGVAAIAAAVRSGSGYRARRYPGGAPTHQRRGRRNQRLHRRADRTGARRSPRSRP